MEAAAYRGRLNAEIRLACLEGNLQIDARAKLAGADFGAAFSDFGWAVPTGTGTGEFAVRTSGPSPAAAVAGLSGSTTLKLEQGVLRGVNLEEALRRSQRRPIDVARDMRVGGTAFDRLSLELALGQGVAHVVNGELAAHGVSANMEGAIDLGARNWDLRVNAVQTDAAGEESPDAAHLSLDIDGPWSQPTIRAAGPADALPPDADPETAPAK
jgi:AsmA protein